jgi:hypothetical protein
LTRQIGLINTIAKVLESRSNRRIVNLMFAMTVELECGSTNAWNNGGAKLVKEEAPRRLKTSGWDPLRRALSSTTRYA